MKTVVLDSSALLAWLQTEHGADVVSICLGNAVISTVNRAEVVSKLFDKKATLRKVTDLMARCDLTGLRTIPFSKDHADFSGVLRPFTKSRGLSLGDRACIALASQLGAPILTTDRAWKQIQGLKVQVVVIR